MIESEVITKLANLLNHSVRCFTSSLNRLILTFTLIVELAYSGSKLALRTIPPKCHQRVPVLTSPMQTPYANLVTSQTIDDGVMISCQGYT